MQHTLAKPRAKAARRDAARLAAEYIAGKPFPWRIPQRHWIIVAAALAARIDPNRPDAPIRQAIRATRRARALTRPVPTIGPT